MPVLPNAPGAIKWEVHSIIGDDSNVVNVLHLVSGDGTASTQAQLDTLAAAAKAAWDANPMGHLSSALVCDHHVLTDLSSPTGPQSTLADGTTGGGSSPSAPASSCLVVQQRTALRGKSYRGRVYFSGIPVVAVANPQHWTTSETTAFQEDLEAVGNTLSALARPYQFAVVSYYGPPTVKAGSISPGNPKRAHSTLRATALVTTVTDSIGDTRIGSQRRRNQ
jgi:hypothetical protein